MVKGRIHSIETFGSVDGPGVRFVIFLQGCRMRCRYCHNVDTWNEEGGEEWSADDLLARAMKYKSYWGKDGGITVSGGEALLQIDFLLELFRKAREKGIHTCIDTAGQPFTRETVFFNKFEELMTYTDLLLVDIKHIDAEKHKWLTGWSPEPIRDMISYLDEIHKPIWIRHVLVPGVTDDEKDVQALGAYIRSLSNVDKVEVLPYHSMGVYKWEQLGIPYTLTDTPAPTAESVKHVQEVLSGAQEAAA